MLVLTRKGGDRVVIDPGGMNISVLVDGLTGSRVKLCFEAPRDIRIVRGELLAQSRERRTDDDETR